MYDIPMDRSFLQFSNGIRHVMPSTDRKLRINSKGIDGSAGLTAGCVLQWVKATKTQGTAISQHPYKGGYHLVGLPHLPQEN